MGGTSTPRDGTPRKAAIPAKTSPIPEDAQNEVPIELPADVPEDVMRNAPVSVKNRLSMTLGLKPRDNADHRISSIYYPKALGDLLKIPQSPKYKASPQLVAARGTAVRSNSPMTDSDADYFSAHERSPSIGHITPDTKKFLDSSATTPETGAVPRISVRSPTVPEENGQRRTSVPTPALTSHSAVMQMAAPPAELSAVTETAEAGDPDRPVSRSRQESQSSLGEPGPEIAESEGETFHQADVEVAVIPREEVQAQSATVHELGAESSSTLHAPAPQPQSIEPDHAAKAADSVSSTTGVLEDVQPVERLEPNDTSHEAEEKAKEEGANQQSKEVVATDAQSEPKAELAQALLAGNVVSVEAATSQNDLPADANDEDIDEPANEDTITTFIAELEAVVPQKPTRPITTQPSSPIELEAPVQTFVLPPRSKAKLTQGKDWSSATIKDRADFFKLPNEQTVKPGLKPKDFRGERLDDPGRIRPLKLKLQKFEGKLVPVQVHTPPKDKPDSPPRTSRLSQDVIANLIDQLVSSTPPGSPIHARTDSTASSNSAQIRSERTSRSFGPPESAPAPPAPGGRSMVNPDFATIGQFEGERKHAKRSSRGSKTSFKDILSGSRRNSSEVSTKSPGHSSRVQSLSARGSGSDMLTSAGKDVLWFKEEGKAPVGVTSS